VFIRQAPPDADDVSRFLASAMAAVNDHLAAKLHGLMLAFLRSTPLWGAELETVRKDRLFRAKRLVRIRALLCAMRKRCFYPVSQSVMRAASSVLKTPF
jgi:hypothetical protein